MCDICHVTFLPNDVNQIDFLGLFHERTKSRGPITDTFWIISMQEEGNIDHSKDRFANDHWQILNKAMALFNNKHKFKSGRMPMSVRSVHVIDQVRAVRFAV